MAVLGLPNRLSIAETACLGIAIVIIVPAADAVAAQQHPGLPETSRIEINRGRLNMRACSFEEAARPFAQG